MFEYESNSENSKSSNSNQSIEYDDFVIDWQSPDYNIVQKSRLWYATLLLISIITILAAILFQGFSLVVVSEIIAIIATVIAVFIASNKKPPIARYSLNQHTLTVNSKTFNLESFKTFSLDDKSGNDEINLIPNNDYAPTINLRLEEETKQQVFDTISEVVPYRQNKDNFIDRISSKINL